MPLFQNGYFKTIFISVFSLIFGCASVQEPTGGPRDKQAPKIVKETPKNLTLNFNAKEINIQLDEFFKLNNEVKEINISPALEVMPFFKVRKNVLNIKFQDTLQSNTTYTINFGEAIVDYNEGNKLKNYSYVFSTGNVIDSLSITGNVKDLLTKDSVLDATVFLIPINQDTIFGKRRANILTTTDSAGNFRFQNLRENTYRIYALKEEGGDKIYNSTKEFIGFRNDSIFLDQNITGINLEIFQEEPEILKVLDRKIENDSRILITLNKELENPGLEIIEPKEINNDKIVEFSRTRDSAMLWLPNLKFDSINVALKSGDSYIDTITLRPAKKDNYKRDFSVSSNINNSRLKPGSDFTLTFSAPVNSFDGSKIKVLEDSIAKKAQVIKDTSSIRRYIIKYPWKIEKEYDITLAEGAFSNILGGKNKEYSDRFTLDEIESYGTLSLDVVLPDTGSNYIVQLINKENDVIRNNPISNNTKLSYTTFPLGTYTIRVIYDRNKNNKWDTGNVKQRNQPEVIWNSEKGITLRANWDLEEKIVIPKLQ